MPAKGDDEADNGVTECSDDCDDDTDMRGEEGGRVTTTSDCLGVSLMKSIIDTTVMRLTRQDVVGICGEFSNNI